MSYAGKIEDLIAERDRLKREVMSAEGEWVGHKTLAALRKDAERYRWLREQDWFSGPLCVVRNPKVAIKLGHDAPSRFRLDEAIDAAMATAQTQQQPDGR